MEHKLHLSSGMRNLQKSYSNEDIVRVPTIPACSSKEIILIIVFVDDCVFCAPNPGINEQEINHLRKDFDLTHKGDLSSFLGVSIQCDPAGTFTFTQESLINKILSDSNLLSCSPNHTPAAPVALGSDPDGKPFKESWHYSSIVGMLFFLANNSQPDIAFATHQCARFAHNTKQLRATAVKTVIWYLKGTSKQGLVFQPQPNLALNCFVDSDFEGLWNSESHDDSISVKSRTGYAIMLCGFPLVWCSKLQPLISLSTMEAEYIALSTSMTKLVPLQEFVTE